MKSLLAVVLALAVVPLASAQMYKYVDKNGKTVYTDQPPPDADTHRLNTGSGASQPSAAEKSAVERDKELQKGRDKAKESAKKSEDAAKQAQAKEQACANARNTYQIYADGGRIQKLDEKGERVFLGDEEIEKERERSKRDMDEACKKS
ncbi:MAG: DUF4124 domain-containing protein [Usitatibacter sp.]